MDDSSEAADPRAEDGEDGEGVATTEDEASASESSPTHANYNEHTTESDTDKEETTVDASVILPPRPQVPPINIAGTFPDRVQNQPSKSHAKSADGDEASKWDQAEYFAARREAEWREFLRTQGPVQPGSWIHWYAQRRDEFRLRDQACIEARRQEKLERKRRLQELEELSTGNQPPAQVRSLLDIRREKRQSEQEAKAARRRSEREQAQLAVENHKRYLAECQEQRHESRRLRNRRQEIDLRLLEIEEELSGKGAGTSKAALLDEQAKLQEERERITRQVRELDTRRIREDPSTVAVMRGLQALHELHNPGDKFVYRPEPEEPIRLSPPPDASKRRRRRLRKQQAEEPQKPERKRRAPISDNEVSFSGIRRCEIKDRTSYLRGLFEYTPHEWDSDLIQVKAKELGIRVQPGAPPPLAVQQKSEKKPRVPPAKIKEPPPNYHPSRLTVSNVTATTAVLRWDMPLTPAEGTISWRVSAKITDTTLVSTLPADTTTSSAGPAAMSAMVTKTVHTLEGLRPSTRYSATVSAMVTSSEGKVWRGAALLRKMVHFWTLADTSEYVPRGLLFAPALNFTSPTPSVPAAAAAAPATSAAQAPSLAPASPAASKSKATNPLPRPASAPPGRPKTPQDIWRDLWTPPEREANWRKCRGGLRRLRPSRDPLPPPANIPLAAMLLPNGTASANGDAAYEYHRPEGAPPTADEVEFLQRDARALCSVLQKAYDASGTSNLGYVDSAEFAAVTGSFCNIMGLVQPETDVLSSAFRELDCDDSHQIAVAQVRDYVRKLLASSTETRNVLPVLQARPARTTEEQEFALEEEDAQQSDSTEEPEPTPAVIAVELASLQKETPDFEAVSHDDTPQEEKSEETNEAEPGATADDESSPPSAKTLATEEDTPQDQPN
eukprot:TRINITY_DN8188_c0_g1_i1.p1 TRINITY_DN8188_c0_g1~~TRINITY_DN8188_c0_g1_i1.p1  ORF type:complete len:898 (-),score=158.80 TRINITY_DN8188_c0_g1_i1:15-2708(-)